MHNLLAGRSTAVAALAIFLLSGGVVLTGCSSHAPAQATESQQGGQAQEGPGSSQRGPRFGQVLLSLGLSDDQKARIRSIMQDARQQSQGADQETRRKNFRAAMAKIDGVLTPAQRDQLHQKLAAMRQNRGAQQ
jgi:Spy/CpxP family protein refolding chaperone